MQALNKTKALLVDEGATFENAFVTTPICCPSRASIMTGLYLHNTGTYNNSVSGNCSSQSWRNGPEKRAFATYLKQKVNLLANRPWNLDFHTRYHKNFSWGAELTFLNPRLKMKLILNLGCSRTSPCPAWLRSLRCTGS